MAVEFLDMKELCRRLAISRKTYYQVINEGSHIYDPNFPKPVKAFTGNKLRFSSIDVENYVRQHSYSCSV